MPKIVFCTYTVKNYILVSRLKAYFHRYTQQTIYINLHPEKENTFQIIFTCILTLPGKRKTALCHELELHELQGSFKFLLSKFSLTQI